MHVYITKNDINDESVKKKKDELLVSIWFLGISKYLFFCFCDTVLFSNLTSARKPIVSLA